MTEYACFWDPGEKGTSLEDVCPSCGRQFGAPIAEGRMPAEIDGMEVIAGRGRGFYSAAYVVKPRNRTRTYIMKVIPKVFYLPQAEGGVKPLGKSIAAEIEVHEELSSLPAVAKYIRDSEGVVAIDDTPFDCYWIQMEHAEGPTLEGLIDTGPRSPKQVAQIALDLLSVLHKLDQLGLHHNDLHTKNVIVSHREAGDRRLDAIDPTTQVKVIDWGSTADASRSQIEAGGKSDATRVAEHVQELLRSYDLQARGGSAMRLDAERRLNYLLKGGIQALSRKDPLRRPTPSDMTDLIQNAWVRALMPAHTPKGLPTLASHYNATTLDTALAAMLFVDPQHNWEKETSDSDPALLTGMRGCGKTHLLKSLAWQSRMQSRDTEGGEIETDSQVVERLEKEDYLGLYLTCDPVGRAKPAPMLCVLVLGYAHEAVKLLEISMATGVGHVNHLALSELVSVVQRHVKWFAPPEDALSLEDVQDALSDALYEAPHEPGEDTSRLAFEQLAVAVTALLDLWQGKRILYLLDDVSRYLDADETFTLLGQLLVSSKGSYAFKVSAETLTIELRSPGGAPAQTNRDYRVIDLGEKVLARISGSQGVRFLDEILFKRSMAASDRVVERPPTAVLGKQPLETIANRIKGLGGARVADLYWGVNALAGMCVGDIGDIILLYWKMLEDAAAADERSLPVAKETQHLAAIAFSNAKQGMLHQREGGSQLHKHATTFARAAHQRLMTSTDRPIQVCEIQLNLDSIRDPREQAEALEQVSKLVQYGVFVIAPMVQRSRSPKGARYSQLRLMYSKLLGLGQIIPLARRARFELKEDAVSKWLTDPQVEQLVATAVVDPELADTESDSADDYESEDAGAGTSRTPEQMSLLPDVIRDRASDVPLVEGCGFAARPLGDQEFASLAGATCMSAYGFEDRSLGVWQRLAASNALPSSVVAALYPDPGRRDDIESFLAARGIPRRPIPVDPTRGEYSKVAAEMLRSAEGDLAVDTTALTKPLIFELVRQSLADRSSILTVHACAGDYAPSDAELQTILPVMKRFPEEDARAALAAMSEGESGPYESQVVDRIPRDPGAPNVLVTFVPLKFDRVEAILRDQRYDTVVTIATAHSSGRRATRSQIVEFLARHYSTPYGGETYQVSALDASETYQLLRRLYSRYALEMGANFDVALTGSKMQTVACGMLAATVPLSAVYYARPGSFNPAGYTQGTDDRLQVMEITHTYAEPQAIQ